MEIRYVATGYLIGRSFPYCLEAVEKWVGLFTLPEVPALDTGILGLGFECHIA